MDLAMLNCYTYTSSNYRWCPKHIALNNFSIGQDEIINNIVSRIPILFKCTANWIDEIIGLLNEYNLLIGVDLYHWLPNSHAWKKRHDYHYSLVVNYDKDKEAFEVLDDDLNGYAKYKIQKNQFILAVENGNLKHEGFIIDCSIPNDYILNFCEVVNNANNIIEYLCTLLIDNDYWEVVNNDNGDCYYEFYAFELFKIVNRQIANKLLVNRLNEMNIIDGNICNILCVMFDDVKKYWDNLKNKFIKLSITNEKLDLYNANKMKNDIINMEIKTWRLLVTHL